jgi:hypothetical protein
VAKAVEVKVDHVVDVASAPPTLPPLSPTLSPGALAGVIDRDPWQVEANVDIVDDSLPFVPLQDGGSRGHWIVMGRAGAHTLPVLVDSAADRSLMAPTIARTLGLRGQPIDPIVDASGATVAATVVVVPELTVAGTTFRNLSVVVPEQALRPDLFLLGADALAHVDLVVDGVDGGLAILPAGTDIARVGPADRAMVVALDTASKRWQVQATAPGQNGLVSFILDVDTGSPLTSVPAAIGVGGGFPADVGRRATVRGAAGEAVEKRGRFVLAPLSLGMVGVGAVSALETGSEHGLLGTDVMGRARVLFSPTRQAMVFLPATAGRGSRMDGKRLVLHLEPLEVKGSFVAETTGSVRFLLRSHNRNTGAWRGGAVEVILPRAGRHIIETGLDFGRWNYSMRLLPVSDPCNDVCLKLLGDWPPDPGMQPSKAPPGPRIFVPGAGRPP